ncbi:MAG: divalent-cation tolerance protein CutA [Candidatus Acidiferrales bacterium]
MGKKKRRGKGVTGKIVVLVTCGSAREAKKVAREVVEAQLAGCANIATSPVKSIYRWEEKVQAASEVLVMIKTTRKRFSALEREIRRVHSYEVPEIITLPVVAGSAGYLQWIEEAVRVARSK